MNINLRLHRNEITSILNNLEVHGTPSSGREGWVGGGWGCGSGYLPAHPAFAPARPPAMPSRKGVKHELVRRNFLSFQCLQHVKSPHNSPLHPVNYLGFPPAIPAIYFFSFAKIMWTYQREGHLTFGQLMDSVVSGGPRRLRRDLRHRPPQRAQRGRPRRRRKRKRNRNRNRQRLPLAAGGPPPLRPPAAGDVQPCASAKSKFIYIFT